MVYNRSDLMSLAGGRRAAWTWREEFVKSAGGCSTAGGLRLGCA